jgi:alkylhydroperoxidase family enzyme
MPKGMEPLVLFRVLARDERLFSRFMGGALLDRGQLTLRERELIILRVCAQHGSEYEWGVHVSMFAERAGFQPEQTAATFTNPADAPCWSPREQLILKLCDALQTTTVTDALWTDLSAEFKPEALLEILMLCGFYRTVSILTNTLHLPLENFAARFPTQPEPYSPS